MNTYDAIMKAAAEIERRPRRYMFVSSECYAPECGSPMCALGWIGSFLGVRGSIQIVAKQLGLSDDKVFYRRMDALLGKEYTGRGGFRSSPSECVKGLRLYATEYHAPAKPVQPTPNWERIAAVAPELERAFARELA
jgi:hypothetical protein